jgi:hypothetical protein
MVLRVATVLELLHAPVAPSLRSQRRCYVPGRTPVGLWPDYLRCTKVLFLTVSTLLQNLGLNGLNLGSAGRDSGSHIQMVLSSLRSLNPLIDTGTIFEGPAVSEAQPQCFICYQVP